MGCFTPGWKGREVGMILPGGQQHPPRMGPCSAPTQAGEGTGDGDDPKVAGSARPQLLEEFCRSTSGIATGEPETGAKSLILPLSSFGQLWSLLNIHSAARTGSVQHLVQCD